MSITYNESAYTINVRIKNDSEVRMSIFEQDCAEMELYSIDKDSLIKFFEQAVQILRRGSGNVVINADDPDEN